MAGVDLLEDDGDLEVGEDDVPLEVVDRDATAVGVLLDDLLRGGEPLVRGSAGGDRVVERADLVPEADQRAEVGEGVTEGGNLPVEHAAAQRLVVSVEGEVVELVVAVERVEG